MREVIARVAQILGMLCIVAALWVVIRIITTFGYQKDFGLWGAGIMLLFAAWFFLDFGRTRMHSLYASRRVDPSHERKLRALRDTHPVT